MAGSEPKYRYWQSPFNVLSILVASLLLVAGGLGLREYMANRLTVVNESGQTVKWLTITVGKRPIRFENILPDATVSGHFHIQSDDSFAVEGELADGTEIHDQQGYVTHGMYRERAKFTVAPGGKISLDQE